MWIYIMGCVHNQLAGQPSCVVKTLTLYITCKLCNHIFHGMLILTDYSLLPFYTTFTMLDLARGSQGQGKTKPLFFIFSQTFQLIRMQFEVVLKQFKLNVPILFWARFNETKEMTAVHWLNLECWHAFGCLWMIWSKLGAMIDTIVLYILILAQLILTLIKVRESKNFCANYLHTRFFNQWNLAYCLDLLMWWTSYSIYLIHSIFKGENSTCVILFRHLQTNFVRTWYDDRDLKLYISISVWMALIFI